MRGITFDRAMYEVLDEPSLTDAERGEAFKAVIDWEFHGIPLPRFGGKLGDVADRLLAATVEANPRGPQEPTEEELERMF